MLYPLCYLSLWPLKLIYFFQHCTVGSEMLKRDGVELSRKLVWEMGRETLPFRRSQAAFGQSPPCLSTAETLTPPGQARPPWLPELHPALQTPFPSAPSPVSGA